jgi:hypothetical protein
MRRREFIGLLGVQRPRAHRSAGAARPHREGDRIAIFFTAMHESGFGQIFLQKSKIEQPQNLAKADLWTSLRLQGRLPFYSDAFFFRETSYPKTSAHRASILKEGCFCPLSTCASSVYEHPIRLAICSREKPHAMRDLLNSSTIG